MSEDKTNWVNIGIGAFIILAIVLLLALILPLSNLAVVNNEIAVISIDGTVTYGDTNITRVHTSAKEIESAINDANSNPEVKAIVLDINSRGGSLAGSDEICELIENSPKPVVSFIGDKCFDESYLIATSSNYTFASSSSSVGGIGLSYINSTRYSKENLSGEFNKNYLKSDKSKKTNEKANESISLENAQKMLDQDYTQFIKKVAENRNLSAKYIAQIANGSKYNSLEAKKLGLIDEIGTKNKAIKKAAKLANVTNYSVVSYPKVEKRLTEILDDNNIFNLKNLVNN